jgi:hypothetical protein
MFHEGLAEQLELAEGSFALRIQNLALDPVVRDEVGQQLVEQPFLFRPGCLRDLGE